MKSSLQPGLKHTGTLDILPAMTVPEICPELTAFAGMPPVFATAMMVGFIEATCIECIAAHLDNGEHTVGTHINVSHVAATPAGMSVRAEVSLAGIEHRKLTFKIEVFDDVGLISEGSHQRAVIDTERFIQKVNEKAQSV